MSYVSEGERERFRALLRQAATEDSRRLHRDRCETDPHRDRLELALKRSGIDVRPAITDNSEIMTKPGLRAYRVVFANGHVSVRGSLEAARRVVDRLSAHDPPCRDTAGRDLGSSPRSGETGDHQLLVETYPAAEESVTGPSDGESLVPSLEPRPVAALTSRRAVLKTPAAAVGAGVGALAAVVVVRRVLRRFA